MKCVDCGKEFMREGQNQKRCGSIKKKIGCSWEKHAILRSVTKGGEPRWKVYRREKRGKYKDYKDKTEEEKKLIRDKLTTRIENLKKRLSALEN